MIIKSKNLNNKELEDLNSMAFNSSQENQPSPVVVRGAIVGCCAGSHYRYLNLPKNHGVSIGDNAVALESDCVVGDNICSFGICAIKTRMENSKENYIDGNSIPGTIREDAVLFGIPCTPVPLGNWQAVDKKSLVWSSENLKGLGTVLSRSKLPCNFGSRIVVYEAGQKQWYEFWKDVDKLEDHSICKINIQEGDPLQIKVKDNTIELNFYVEFVNIEGAKKQLLLEGIKQWEKTYKLVFGHEADLIVAIHEKNVEETWKDSQKSIVIKYMPEDECLKEGKGKTDIDTTKRSKTIYLNGAKNWEYAHAEVYIYPIEPINQMKDGKYLKNEDGKYIYDVIRKTDNEIRNIVTHEIGHVMGLVPSHDGAIPANFSLHGGYGGDDIMSTLDYSSDIKIYALNIEMIINAAYYRKVQYYTSYDSTEAINNRKAKCRNVKEG